MEHAAKKKNTQNRRLLVWSFNKRGIDYSRDILFSNWIHFVLDFLVPEVDVRLGFFVFPFWI